MPELALGVLGPLQAVVWGVDVPVGGPKQRGVLALLALRANSVVPVDEMVDVVWGGQPPRRPAALLQVYGAHLRALLEPGRTGAGTRLVSAPRGYRLVVAPDELDLLAVDVLLRDARAAVRDGEPEAARDALRRATGLWRGPAFADLINAPDLQPELSALEERRVTALEEALELDLALGDAGEVVAEVEALVAAHPFRERLRAVQVRALYASQRQVEALEAARAARRELADGLGLDPGVVLRELELAVLRQDPELDRKVVLATPGVRRERIGNLPTSLSSFVGRTAPLSELVRLLKTPDRRLVTLTGPGGTGKTRLALAAAGAVQPHFDDGACWVPLDTVARPEQVPDAVAAALGLSASSGQDLRRRTVDFLRPRRLLLVLDNLEHVLDAWPVVVELLAAAPHLTVLVTSRLPVRVTGEQVFAVPPLELPERRVTARSTLMETEAVRLFLDRARLTDRGFDPCDGDLALVGEVCRRLDGLPLAIELAAARVGELRMPTILEALEDTLGLLTEGPRDASDRQRSLRGAIAWSYDLLSPQARVVFTSMAVFTGAVPSDAVMALLGRWPGDGLEEVLQSLVRASLLRTSADNSSVRFSMLRTISSYARELLTDAGDERTLRLRHAEHYLSLAETAAPLLEGPDQVEAYHRLHADRLEFDAALEWTAKSPDAVQRETGLRLLATLTHFWEIAGQVQRPRAVAGSLLAGPVIRDPAVRAAGQSAAGTLCWLTGELDEATRWHWAALDAYRELQDEAGVAWSMMCLATQATMREDLTAARSHATDALELAQHAEHSSSSRTACCALMVLGVVASWEGDWATAEQLHRRALAPAQRAGDRWLTGKVMLNLGDAIAHRGEPETAAFWVRQALEVSQSMGDRPLALYGVEALGELSLHLGQPRRAARLLAAGHSCRKALALPLDDHEQRRFEDIMEQTRIACGSTGFATAWAEGSRSDLDDAVTEALAPTFTDRS